MEPTLPRRSDKVVRYRRSVRRLCHNRNMPNTRSSSHRKLFIVIIVAVVIIALSMVSAFVWPGWALNKQVDRQQQQEQVKEPTTPAIDAVALMFGIFGAVLSKTGGSQTFIKFAQKLTGKTLYSGAVKVHGNETGEYVVRENKENAKFATAVWYNDTVVFQATGSAAGVGRFVQKFPL